MLNKFIDGYIACALWSSADVDGDPIDGNYNSDDLAMETKAKIEKDCHDFYNDNKNNLGKYCDEIGKDPETAWEYAGHDFWLTRNGHGCGFWDRILNEELGNVLTEAAKSAGGCDLYVGDNGKLYIM